MDSSQLFHVSHLLLPFFTARQTSDFFFNHGSDVVIQVLFTHVIAHNPPHFSNTPFFGINNACPGDGVIAVSILRKVNIKVRMFKVTSGSAFASYTPLGMETFQGFGYFFGVAAFGESFPFSCGYDETFLWQTQGLEVFLHKGVEFAEVLTL